MFKVKQIIPATRLLSEFRGYARALEIEPQALLIIQRKGIPLVLMPADLYEYILEKRFKETSGECLEPENFSI